MIIIPSSPSRNRYKQKPAVLAMPPRRPPVQLTKIYYYGANNRFEVPTVSRQVSLGNCGIVKKNIFGGKWVLRINEPEGGEKKESLGILVTGLFVVILCLILVGLAVLAVLFSKDLRHLKQVWVVEDISFPYTSTEATLFETTTEKKTRLTSEREILIDFCSKCNRTTEVCLNVADNDETQCREIRDTRDPTGCGGLCQLSEEFCQQLDRKMKLFQCQPIGNGLNCDEQHFKCSDENLCVSKRKRCDGIVDCLDQSDELHCACNLTTHFHCGSNTSCLINTKRCNKTIDCWDRSDETDCSQDCKKGEFACQNGECVEEDVFCDGVYHCLDRSDEPKGCEN